MTPGEEIYGKLTQETCIYLHLFIAVVASQIYEVLLNSPKIETYSSSRSSKVIDLGVNRKQ